MNEVVVTVCAFCAVCCVSAFAVDFDNLTPEQRVEWAESFKTHHRVGAVSQTAEDGTVSQVVSEKSGSRFSEKEMKRRRHRTSQSEADRMYASHTNMIGRIHRFDIDSEEFKTRWLKRHEGATEADFEEWKNLDRAGKQAWSAKWREEHK